MPPTHFFRKSAGPGFDVLVLIYLCMYILTDLPQGHQVIGVEGILAPVEQFFSENDIKVNKEWDGSVGGWIFTSEDNRIKIVVCDLFKITPEGTHYNLNTSILELTEHTQFDTLWLLPRIV